MNDLYKKGLDEELSKIIPNYDGKVMKTPIITWKAIEAAARAAHAAGDIRRPKYKKL